MATVEGEDVQGVVLLVVPGEDDVALVGDVEELHGEGEIVSRGPDGPHVLSLLDTVDVDGACVGREESYYIYHYSLLTTHHPC